MSLTLVAAPAVEPLTEEEVWDHLRVNLTGDSPESGPVDRALIAALMTAARQTIDGRDGWLGRALVTQTWDLTLDAFPLYDRPIGLKLPPVQSVTHIKYIDDAGTLQTLGTAAYALSADTYIRPRIDLAYGQSWPVARCQPDAVTVRFVAGYAPGGAGSPPTDARANVPAPIKAALKLMIGHLYEHREDVQPVAMSELPMASQALLAPYRVWSFG